ncbi:MAG: hypothetical protein C0504_15105 [Candidatus Solibacter sp.]|nr:hypothetical protein [Candidatus Solibacter sp.]
MTVKLQMLVAVLAAAAVAGPAWGQQPAEDWQARLSQAELRGEAAAALDDLGRAIEADPTNPQLLALRARALDARRHPAARAAYERALSARGLAAAGRERILRRLAALDLIEGDRTSAGKRLSQLAPPVALAESSGARKVPTGEVVIPGPMSGFSRMAALSPDLPETDILTALSRNVVTSGYQAVSGSESLEQTEYLKLILRYVSQARELETLASPDKILKIEQCESPRTGELLRILGFRMRGGCGSEVVLETVNASRAFLTIDSGFPIAGLEQALRSNRVFEMDYKPTRVKVLYGPEYWLSAKEKFSGELIDAFLGDPALCRLYLGIVKLDPETAEQVRKTMPVARVRAFAHVFDFFGGMLRLKDGKAVVPGGQRSAAAWSELAGASPDKGVEFIEKLIMKDDGWMASYFDSLSRIEGPVQDYLTEPERIKRFYTALRGRVTSPGPARPVFRSNTDLMLLTTRLRMAGPNQPHLPGGLEVWKNLFVKHPQGRYDGKLTKAAAGWKEPDDLLEALFGLSRKAVENEPLKIFLSISDIERRRGAPIAAPTVDRLARAYRLMGSQYPLFSESPSLSDASMIRFLDAAEAISKIGDNVEKANTAGTMQALAALWQVLCRQKLIAEQDSDAVFSAIIEPFLKAREGGPLFDAGRSGVAALLKATGSPEDVNPQDRMIDLLTGSPTTEDQQTLAELRADMLRVFEAQKLVSLKVIFDLADHLESLSRGERLNAALLNRLAARVSDLSLPKASMSAQERNATSFGYWTERHLEDQRKLNFRAVIDKAAGDAGKLKNARGLLAPILRDTLVGLLYVHYAPPGAQLLYTNPLFARSHDFIGIQGAHQTWRTTEVLGSGWPSSAGGRLVGSLATLPYALAEAEQNFLIPTREQALIWGDLVPQMLVSAKLPRWWNVSGAQMHFLALHLRHGEDLLAAAVTSPELRTQVLDLLDKSVAPVRLRRIANELAEADLRAAIEDVTPSEFYQLGRYAVERKLSLPGGFGSSISALAAADPGRLNHQALSDAFGTPKPTLANTMKPQLLNLRTFPTLMGYSSRIMAESWESNNLFFAALADELRIRPSELNLRIPEWTQRTVEQIFATHLEDWPALLRSMRIIASQARAEARKPAAAQQKASLE